MSDTIEQIQRILRNDPDLTPQVADALCELYTVAYNQFANRPDKLHRPKFTDDKDIDSDPDDVG